MGWILNFVHKKQTKIFMNFITKRRHKPLYKKFLPLKKNVQNRDKFMKFKKKNDKNFNIQFLDLKKKSFMILYRIFYLILKIFLIVNLNITYKTNKDSVFFMGKKKKTQSFLGEKKKKKKKVLCVDT